MIDTNKLVAKLDETLAALRVHAQLSELALAVDPSFVGFHRQMGKNEGAVQVIEAIKRGVARGTFDVEPDTIPAPPPSEDMDEEAPEEEPVKFGAFLVFEDDDSTPSRNDGLRGVAFDTRSEAWAAINEHGEPALSYAVRPL